MLALWTVAGLTLVPLFAVAYALVRQARATPVPTHPVVATLPPLQQADGFVRSRWQAAALAGVAGGGCTLFQHVERMQGAHLQQRGGGCCWGRVLDAGTGAHSLRWLLRQPHTALAAVTGEAAMHEALALELQDALGPHDRILLANWRDAALLQEERFDVVVADYLLGALEAHAPFFQDVLFQRLRKRMAPGGRLYATGAEPLPQPPPGDARAAVVAEVAALRDAAVTLAGRRPHREHPAEYMLRQLRRQGLRVLEVAQFPAVHSLSLLRLQLDVAEEHACRLADAALARALLEASARLRRRLSAHQWPHRFGQDYVVAAQLPPP